MKEIVRFNNENYVEILDKGTLHGDIILAVKAVVDNRVTWLIWGEDERETSVGMGMGASAAR